MASRRFWAFDWEARFGFVGWLFDLYRHRCKCPSRLSVPALKMTIEVFLIFQELFPSLAWQVQRLFDIFEGIEGTRESNWRPALSLSLSPSLPPSLSLPLSFSQRRDGKSAKVNDTSNCQTCKNGVLKP